MKENEIRKILLVSENSQLFIYHTITYIHWSELILSKNHKGLHLLGLVENVIYIGNVF